MRRRNGAIATVRRNLPHLLTNLEDSGEMITLPSDEGETGLSPHDKHGLGDGEWLSLVEQLLELSETDFEAAVAAVRLHRLFEEGEVRRDDADEF